MPVTLPMTLLSRIALANGFAVVRMKTETPEYLAAGTWLGLGRNIVATSASLVCPRDQAFALSDIYLIHMLTGERAKIKYGVQGRLNELLYVEAEKTFVPDQKIMEISDFETDRNPVLVQPSYAVSFMKQPDLDRKPVVREGYFLHHPTVQDTRMHGRFGNSAFVGAASLNYPHELDAGAPIIGPHGALAGILTAPNEYHELRNQGFYTPADLAVTYAKIALKEWDARQSVGAPTFSTWANYSR